VTIWGQQLIRPLRIRFWAEALSALATAVLTVVTVVVPDWIEAVFGAAPDDGSGLTERAVLAVFAGVSVALTAAAYAEHRRWRGLPAADSLTP
jgi:hypothetical protein